MRGLFLLLSLFLVASCSHLNSVKNMITPKPEKPTVELVHLSLGKLSLFEQKIRLRLRVSNPNDRDIPVSSLSCFVKLEKIEVAQGVVRTPFLVPALGTHEFDMDVSASLLKVGRPLLDLLKTRRHTLNYQLTGTLNVDIVFVGPLTFNKNGKITVRR